MFSLTKMCVVNDVINGTVIDDPYTLPIGTQIANVVKKVHRIAGYIYYFDTLRPGGELAPMLMLFYPFCISF